MASVISGLTAVVARVSSSVAFVVAVVLASNEVESVLHF